MKIDFHVHTSERSPCGRSAAVAQVQAAVDAGLDVMAFTDHGQFPPPEELAEWNRLYSPMLILSGTEITIDGEDLIVLGVHDHAIIGEIWDYPRLHGFVRQRGGCLVLAHPFRYHAGINIPVREFPPDAIEVCSNNTPEQAADQILALARDIDIPVVSNSDAHKTETLGRYYNLFDSVLHTEQAVLGALRQGLFTAVKHTDAGMIIFKR